MNFLPNRWQFSVSWRLASKLAYWHKRCALCQDYLKKDERIICDSCQAMMVLCPPPVLLKISEQQNIRLYRLGYYQFPLNNLISNYKDDEDNNALLVLETLIQKLPKPKGCHKNNTIIIPVPTTASRLVTRGFFPVLTLAKTLSNHWQLPIWQGIARDERGHQRGLARLDRLMNIQGDFYLTNHLPCSQIILFDDVATTGATLTEMARLIYQVNPKARILAVCLAHGTPALDLSKER